MALAFYPAASLRDVTMMKLQFSCLKQYAGLCLPVVIVLMLTVSTADAEWIVENSADMNLSNYLQQPTLYPYFDDNVHIIDFEGTSHSFASTCSIGNDKPDSYYTHKVGNYYQSQGIVFDNNTLFMGGGTGYGAISRCTVIGTTTKHGGGSAIRNGTFSLTVVDPATGNASTVQSIASWIADGPTNEVVVKYYDLSNNLIGSIVAPAAGSTYHAYDGAGNLLGTAPVDSTHSKNAFVGWSDPNGIHKVVYSNTGLDDYYTDQLTFGNRRSIPPSGGSVARSAENIGDYVAP